MNRREFIEMAGGLAALSAVQGCAGRWCGSGGATAMTNFAVAPMEKIRIGFIGIGERGTWAVHRISGIPVTETAALCDLRPEAVDSARKWLVENKKRGVMHEYKGRADSWKGVCDDPDVDVVYICTPAPLHAEMEVYALNAGKHVMTEVPGAQTLEECWAIVEAAEKNRRHCMMLENTVYGELELLAWNICHKGMIGTLTHAEGAYIHNLCWRHMENPTAATNFRTQTLKDRALGPGGAEVHKRGNTYPTHPLGPICTYMDMNRGDRMERVSSFSSLAAAHREFAAATYGKDEWQNKVKWLTGDMNTSVIKTAKGRTIMLQADMSTPRPYSRINLVQGTKGFYRSFPESAPQATFAKKPGGDAMGWSQKEFDLYEGDAFKELRKKFMHPLWKAAGEVAKKGGGHGGCDFMMDLRWIWCLKNGLPLDMDVYDLASWSSIVPCSAKSDALGGEPVTLPDFTRGAWRTARPQEIGTVDYGMLGLDPSRQKKDAKEMKV